MSNDYIPFNWPHLTGKELDYIAQSQAKGRLSGDGYFSQSCHTWLEHQTGCEKALLTHSCTAALELSALLLDIQAGDEIIMPSYTFVSTANAFVLRGGIPVFVDIREDTLNLDERLIEEAVTTRTRAIVAVHYAGVACEMNTIMSIAKHYNLRVVEDAAQGVLGYYNGQALGAIGDLGTLSFHETKNVTSGEGGALLVNDPELSPRAEIMREKGTDRTLFFRGEVDRYTWIDIGSSFLPGELVAAFLLAQLEAAESITHQRLTCWHRYHQLLAPLERQGLLRRPIIPPACQHNAHMYYILLSPDIDRQAVLCSLKEYGVGAVFHYNPLHLSPAGRRFGRAQGNLEITCRQSERLVRLPLWAGISEAQQHKVCHLLATVCADLAKRCTPDKR